LAQANRGDGVTRKLQSVIVIGATSGIAQAICRILSQRHCRLFLIARNSDQLAAVAADMRVRGADIAGHRQTDLTDTSSHKEMLAVAWQQMGTVDAAIIAHGILGDQKRAESDWAEAAAILNVNFTSVGSLVTHLANAFEQQGSGQIVAIGSVAGDRGRKTNYVYGSAKSAVETFLQGVRHRLAPRGVGVLLVKPGFVDTPMTAHLPRSPLFASANDVARTIVSAMENGESTVYAPFFWKFIMLIVRCLPESIFNRLSF
jgi:decaprenylphospho-beta-D-erythro-pentofuranosid-2-ulose 2-reductase